MSSEFLRLPDLLAARVGGEALLTNDDFFAGKENLTQPGRGVFIADKYTDRGKWMDGWESRRKRGPGHDWCILKLGMPGAIVGVDIDTNHFTGNYPEFASLDACAFSHPPSEAELLQAAWENVIAMHPLQGGSPHPLAAPERFHAKKFTHVRLNIFPDGGVARLRIHGRPMPSPEQTQGAVDWAALKHGGRVLLSSNMYFGDANHLLLPGRGTHMGDGWETKRRRGPGNDWCIVELGNECDIKKIEIDTAHFKGNFPDSASLEGCRLDPAVYRGAPAEYFASLAVDWRPILPQTKLSADHQHHFERELQNHGPMTHVRLSIYPDGGVSRLRVIGTSTLSKAV